MKSILYPLLMAALLMATGASEMQAKTAILVAHYGSSDDATREKTIHKITLDVAQLYPSYEVKEALISPAVRRSLTKRGITCCSPTEGLQQLAAAHCDSVYVLSTTILDGAEMAEVRKSVEATKKLFKHVKVCRPLCFSPADCEQLAEALKHAASPNEEQAVVWVGHGNSLPSNATYCQLDHMLSVSGARNIHVSTIEGYPTAAATIKQLQANAAIKRVTLIPLLLVCGNHTKEDIAKDFAQQLNSAGYETSVVMKGLAENPQIRQLYLNRLRSVLYEQ